MHQQIRLVVPTGSPQDVAKPLRDLNRAGINLISASGSNVEQGGEVAFSVDDKDIASAMQVLDAYSPRLVDVKVCWLAPNKPGELLRCIETARRETKWANKAVRDIAITTEHNSKGELGVQVYFDEAASS
jgi:hypothetical protein